MIPKTFTEEIQLSNGRTISLETGKLANKPTVLLWLNVKLYALATAVSARKASPVDFLPLTVDYREKFAAAEDSQVDFSNVKHGQAMKKS